VLASVQAQKQERDYVVFAAQEEVRALERRLLVSPENKTVNTAFRKVCYLLLQLAQKHVPSSVGTHADYVLLLHCIRLLQDMGFKPDIEPEIDADAGQISPEIARSSFEYRRLRNKIMASLSLIADLPEKPVSPGTPDFQAGVREGYRRASDIAVLFLEDIDCGS
jgi:hypothetical protein